jgi:hypothetical protein
METNLVYDIKSLMLKGFIYIYIYKLENAISVLNYINKIITVFNGIVIMVLRLDQ